MIRKFSVNFPIIGMTVLIVLSITISLYYVEVKAIRDTLWAKEKTKAEDIYYIVESLIQRDSNKLSTLSKSLKEHSGLIKGFFKYSETSSNIGQIKESMDKIFSDLNVDIFFASDRNNNIIYQAHTTSYKNDVLNFAETTEVLNGNDILITSKIDNKWAISSIVPVSHEGKLVGTILIGIWIDNGYAQKIAFETEVHVSFGSIDGVIASSLPDEKKADVDQESIRDSIMEVNSIRVENAAALNVIHYSPMEIASKLFCLVVEIDTKFSHQLLAQNKKHIIKISIIILIIAITLCTVFTLYMLRPLKILKTRAKETVKSISGVDLKEEKGNEFQSMIQFIDTMVETVTNHISERIEAEEALKTHKLDLENQVGERTAELKKTNEKLIRTIGELERRTSETLLFNQFGDLLQACDSEEETHTLMGRFCKKLFPQDSGYLSIFSKIQKVLKVVASWGNIRQKNDEFTPNQCWAVRRGSLHFVRNPEIDPLCPHLKGYSDAVYLCAPMIAQGEVLGMIHLRFAADLKEESLSTDELEYRYKSKQMLATSLLEHYSLPLTNLRLRETLRMQSIHDPLTGLFNRRYMKDSLEFETRRAKRHKSSLGIIMVDVDHFKNFNDTYGHEVGDIVLIELGSFLKNNIRKEDIACRYGGEEFILILPETSLENSHLRAENLKAIQNGLKIKHNDHVHNIAVSIGVASFPQHGSTIEETLNAADAALYKAKTNGRNRVEIYGVEQLPKPSLRNIRSVDLEKSQ